MSMTVGELKKLLEQWDDDTTVIIAAIHPGVDGKVERFRPRTIGGYHSSYGEGVGGKSTFDLKIHLISDLIKNPPK